MNRRGFLGTLAALAVVPTVAKALPDALPPQPVVAPPEFMVVTQEYVEDCDYWIKRIRECHDYKLGRDATDDEITYWSQRLDPNHQKLDVRAIIHG